MSNDNEYGSNQSFNAESAVRDTVLIVDDDRLDLLALYKTLSPEYDIFLSKYGEEAIRLASENRPDIIVLDVMMPDVNGFDVLLRLKASSLTRDIPVIFLSGLESDLDEEKGLLLGASDYIQKPIKSNVVKARIAAQLRARHLARRSALLSVTDPLTDCFNRRGFADRLTQEWERGCRDSSPLAFLYIDIDHFKDYNDVYGHPQGDVALKAVADACRSVARRSTDLPVRLGGEEFGLLMPETDIQGAVSVAETLRKRVEATDIQLLSDPSDCNRVTISIGACSVYPTRNADPDSLVSEADKYLFQAKRSGRNMVCHKG